MTYEQLDKGREAAIEVANAGESMGVNAMPGDQALATALKGVALAVVYVGDCIRASISAATGR